LNASYETLNIQNCLHFNQCDHFPLTQFVDPCEPQCFGSSGSRCVRGPAPEGPWPGKEARFRRCVVTGRRQPHSARFEASEATRMISEELNSADSGFAGICSTALRSVICSSRPKRVAPISPGLQEKVQPASWILPPNPYPSRF